MPGRHGRGGRGQETGFLGKNPVFNNGIMFVAVTPDGQRTMFGYRGANVRLDPDGLDVGAIRAARWLHISGYALLAPPQSKVALRALSIARDAGLQISLDPGLEIVLREPALVRALLPCVDVLLPNEDELGTLIGAGDPQEALFRLHRGGVPTVALKLGARGCLLSANCGRSAQHRMRASARQRVQVPAFRSPQQTPPVLGMRSPPGLLPGD